jgi:hypothetical protein
MLYRLMISLLSAATLFAGAATGMAQGWHHGGQRAAFRAGPMYQGAQARVVPGGYYGFGPRHGYYYGYGWGDHWRGYGYAWPRHYYYTPAHRYYYYSTGPSYYYAPAPGYVYQPPTYYYYTPSYYYTPGYYYTPSYGYAYYPEYGHDLNLNLQVGGD